MFSNALVKMMSFIDLKEEWVKVLVKIKNH